MPSWVCRRFAKIMKLLRLPLLGLLISCHAEAFAKRYLVVTPKSGFANRMRVLASAAVIAKRSNRILIVDWQTEANVCQADFHDLFENDIPELKNVKSVSKARGRRYVMTNDLTVDLQALYTAFPNIVSDKAEVVHVEAWSAFKPADMDFAPYVDACASFYRSLVPTSIIRRRIAQVRRTFASAGQMVGVHYRNWENPAFARAPRKAYIDAMLRTLEEKPTTVFYVATDDAKALFDFRRQIGADRIRHSPSVSGQRNSTAAQQKAVADWFLLGLTDFVIGTYQSSFSDEAALMTKEQRKLNVGPRVYDFHTIICFDENGRPFERPWGFGDTCMLAAKFKGSPFHVTHGFNPAFALKAK